jgi:RNA polymerase sigma-70 factor (ECF subfamily)
MTRLGLHATARTTISSAALRRRAIAADREGAAEMPDKRPMNHSALDDAEIIGQLQAGESRAMSALYDRYAQLVFSLAVRILGDQSAAEEVVQEVFVKVWRRAADYDKGRAKFISWLAQIAHNQAIDHLRQRRAHPAAHDDASLEGAVDDSPTPFDAAVQSIERRRITAALAEISQDECRVIELAYFGGYSHQEIANKLRQPLGTVKTRMRRGMQNLKTQLGNGFSG